MKERWTYKKLGEICRVINGRAYSKDEMLSQGKYRLLRVGNFFTNDSWYYSDLELEEDKYCDNGDLLYAWSASFGPRIWDGEKVIYHYHIWKMVCSAEIDKYFLCYWLDSDELKKQTMTSLHGATMAHITKGIIENAIVSYPSLSEQQSIVDYLDTAFAKIDAMKANAEKALNEAKALFQASLKEMLEPKEGWEEKMLKDICSDIVDCPHTTPQKVGFPTQYPCIRTSELKGGSIDWSTMQYLDENEYKKRVSRLVPKPNDLVYGREGTYGDAVLLPNGYSFSLGQRTMLLRPNEIYIIPRFLLYSMISPHVYQQAKAKNSGCGVGHVNVKDIKVFRIGLPTIDIQQSIVATLDSLKSKVDRLQANYNKISQECDALKQAILRQVFE